MKVLYTLLIIFLAVSCYKDSYEDSRQYLYPNTFFSETLMAQTEQFLQEMPQHYTGYPQPYDTIVPGGADQISVYQIRDTIYIPFDLKRSPQRKLSTQDSISYRGFLVNATNNKLSTAFRDEYKRTNRQSNYDFTVCYLVGFPDSLNYRFPLGIRMDYNNYRIF